jgi:hypothetical protein
LVGLRVSIAWIWVQEGGGVEDEVEGFQVFAGFLKKGVGWKMRWKVLKYLLGFSRRFSSICWVSEEGSSREFIHFFPLKSCDGCCAP